MSMILPHSGDTFWLSPSACKPQTKSQKWLKLHLLSMKEPIKNTFYKWVSKNNSPNINLKKILENSFILIVISNFLEYFFRVQIFSKK